MRILSVTGTILKDDAASWRIRNIIYLLKTMGHNVMLVQYVRDRNNKYSDTDNFNIDGVPSKIISVSKYSVHHQHLRELRKDEYNLVYGNTHYGALCALAGCLTKVPLVVDMHGGHIEEFLINRQSDTLTGKSHILSFELLHCKLREILVHNISRKIICVSRKMIRYLHERKGISLEKMTYVPNGVDLTSFKPVDEKKLNVLKHRLQLQNKITFGYIGGFHKWQGVGNLIMAAKRCKDPDCVFIIVGGPHRYKEENILFIPWTPREQLLEYYSVCDILVLPRPRHPSTEIAAPTKFAEYTAMGKPILTTDVGDPADLVKKYDCGIVVADNSPDNLLSGIFEFKRMPESQLKIMGERARILAEQEFDWSKVAILLQKAIYNV